MFGLNEKNNQSYRKTGYVSQKVTTATLKKDINDVQEALVKDVTGRLKGLTRDWF